MKTLVELYQEHHGKSSDKWSIYLSSYHDILSSLKPNQVSFLEIGVQNGGSLDIWNKYFPDAKCIIGCDIDENCANLVYEEEKIKVVIGNSSTVEIKEKIKAIASSLTVAIDDGSHDSSDIIKSFLLYFPLIEDGGYYIIEDLHCSYWQSFEGGLYDPYSSMAFLKKLADIPNHEHWGIQKSERDYLKPFYQHYRCEDFDSVDYTQIHSVQFINSLCIIKKKTSKENILGPRFITGEEEAIVKGNIKVHGSLNIAQDQSENPWGNMPTFPEMEWQGLVEKNKYQNDLRKNDLLTIEKLNRDIIYFKSVEEVLRKEIEANRLGISEKDQLIHRLSHDNHALLTSTSWKITQPMRTSVTHLRKIRRGVDISTQVIKTHGLRRSLEKAKALYNQHGVRGIIDKLRFINQLQNSYQILERKELAAVGLTPEETLIPKVLIIAEMSIPQCRKYRVDQKIELFKKLGVEATALSWTQQNECMEALQTHSMVIFYRVPAFESMDRIFDECERLNLTTLWEVDDLIFDREVLANSKTLNELDKNTFNGLLEGASLYKRAMLKCRGTIASTQHLAEAMLDAGAKYAYVVENALDPETIITAQNLPRTRTSETDGIVRIVYGSGTSTHNVDFQQAADAILNVLKANKHVHFRLVGVLELPASFDTVQSQIERVELCPYKDYLKVLSECDISLAPLEDYVFNYSKSNIKYIEASILGIPSVCSPLPTFSRVIEHGVNGFLCQTPAEWEDTLVKLVDSVELRNEVGLQAQTTVLNHYSLENIAKEQVAVIADKFTRLNETTKQKNILSVNCYYNPRSFGGATVVAEEINKRFDNNEHVNIHVVTSLSEEYVTPYHLRRYGAFGHECYGIGLPHFLREDEQILNHNIDPAFKQILDVVKPDVVHFHSIQGLGISMLDICSERNIPIIVTAHDYWWLYDHQFILSFDDKHKLRGIFEGHDSEAIKDQDEVSYYILKKRKALMLADKILAPSAFTRQLYTGEGYTNVQMNKNGVNYPQLSKAREVPKVVTFGYVGGNTNIKGYHLIKEAFSNISAEDAKVVIVDNTLNLGFRTFNDSDLEGLNNYEVVPAFTQNNMDEFYGGIDVLLYPTQSKESFGLTVREALIRNVWVITSNAGGAPEDIIEGENGIVIPFDNDAKKLLEAVEATINHFRTLSAGPLPVIPHSHIRSFDEQYEELADIYLSTH
jgi:glycosyltransferase involved in cell wall biosynthesis